MKVPSDSVPMSACAPVAVHSVVNWPLAGTGGVRTPQSDLLLITPS